MIEETKFLSVRDVLDIHALLIERSPLAGESDAVLDIGLLDSAISQPQQTFFGEFLNADIYEQAAAYLFSLANNHTFENGNKRTALAVTVSFLRINGYRMIISKDDAENLVLDAVENRISKDDIAKIFRDRGVLPLDK